jgi:hypothetical protein
MEMYLKMNFCGLFIRSQEKMNFDVLKKGNPRRKNGGIKE